MVSSHHKSEMPLLLQMGIFSKTIHKVKDGVKRI